MIAGIVAGHPAVAASGLPTTIGEEFGGGYYIGDVVVAASTYAIIMAGAEGEAMAQWSASSNSVAGATSATDGQANTAAMEAIGIAGYPAAQHCVNYVTGEHADWYMPAKDELALAWTNRAVLGAMAMQADWYFSSMQSSSSNAWAQLFSGGTATTVGKLDTYRVRPVRRLRR